MARKKPHEEHENHERWLVSYADFITLLFAFFVVMYAVSSVNEGKYRVLSDALVFAFKESKKSMEPVQVGEVIKSASNSSVELLNRPTLLKVPLVVMNNQQPENREQTIRELAGSVDGKGGDIEKIAIEVAQALQQLVDLGLVTITLTDLWVEVDIKDSILFPSGSSLIREDAVAVLKKVAAILNDFSNPLRVEGFTDNVPINTLLYPSNWELSTARAASVVRLFERLGVKPERMSALGYGEHRPLAGNDTAEGRAKNRRVVLLVLADKQVERLLDDTFRHSPGSGPRVLNILPAPAGSDAGKPQDPRSGAQDSRTETGVQQMTDEAASQPASAVTHTSAAQAVPPPPQEALAQRQATSSAPRAGAGKPEPAAVRPAADPAIVSPAGGVADSLPATPGTGGALNLIPPLIQPRPDLKGAAVLPPSSHRPLPETAVQP